MLGATDAARDDQNLGIFAKSPTTLIALPLICLICLIGDLFRSNCARRNPLVESLYGWATIEAYLEGHKSEVLTWEISRGGILGFSFGPVSIALSN
jgi:hypothetical protein